MTDRPERVLAKHLLVGDVVDDDGGALEILQEPELGHRGWSLFDEFEIVLIVRVRPLGRDRPQFVRWRPDQELRLLKDETDRRSA